MSATAQIDLSVLPEDQRDAIGALIREVVALKEITQRQEHLIAELNQALYGKKSEKLSEDDRQLAFEELETALAEVDEQKQAQAPADDKPKRERAKARRKSRNLPDSLPRIEVVIEPDSLECPCGCGLMHKIGEDRSTRIDIIPAQHRVIETIRPKYACRACTDGVRQAPAPARLIEGGLPTEAFIAHVLVGKYADHLPFCDRAGSVKRPSSRSILLSVVGTPPQDANFGGREAPNLYLGLVAPGANPSSSRPSSLPGTSHRHPKVADLNEVSRVVRAVCGELPVHWSCRGDVRGAGRRMGFRPIGRAGLPHGQEDRGKLPADGHDGLLHAGSLRDPKAPGLERRHDADTAENGGGSLEQHRAHARIPRLGDATDNIGLARLPSPRCEPEPGADVAGPGEAIGIIHRAAEAQRHHDTYAGHRHQEPCHRIGLRQRRELAVDPRQFVDQQCAHAQHGLHDSFQDLVAISEFTGPGHPRFACHSAHLEPEVPERCPQGVLGGRHLLHEERARRQQRAGLLGVERFDVHPFEPAQPNQLGDAARVVAIGFYPHRGESGADVAGLHHRNRETLLHQSVIQPLREVSGFEPHMFYAAALMADCLGYCGRLARGARFLDDAAAFVNDTDMRLVEGNIEANKKFHGLNSLIGCNEGHGPNVAVWRKARSAHLYRQSQILARGGIDIHRSTLADWVGVASFHLKPVVDRLAEHLKRSTKLFMDETTAPVLDPGRGKTKTGFLWALARDDRSWGGEDPPGVVYFYAPGRHGENAETFLTGFDGILQIDGYAGYNRLTRPARKGGEPITVAHCWAHARRKLKEVFDRDGSRIAAEGLRRIAELYSVEKDIRGCAPGQRLSARQARSAPLVTAFGEWLQGQRLRVSAKSRLGEKLAYIHNHWNGLQTFLTDGRVEIDSNNVENLVRPIALNRKNALFAGHDEGGKTWGRIASLIETCKINSVEPFAYLKSTLEAIAAGHPQSRIDELLPWNFQPSS